VKVHVTDFAKVLLRKERAWWRKNRDEKTLFTEEFIEAKARLRDPPKLEVYGYFEGLPVRRLLMKSVHCHAYYIILEDEDQVEVVSFWGTKRGKPAEMG